jgi:hypothetical protein
VNEPPIIGQPQRQGIVVNGPDGKPVQLEIGCVGLFTDGAMQTIANIVSQVVAAELNARGLTPLKETAKSS